MNIDFYTAYIGFVIFASALISMLLYTKIYFWIFFFISLTTEFLWIQIGDSIFRISYFFGAALILVFLLKNFNKVIKLCFNSKLFLLFTMFLIHNSAALILQPKLAVLKGYALLLILSFYTTLTFFFLAKYKELEKLVNIFLWISFVSCIVAILQYFLSKANSALAIGDTQVRNILVESRMPSLFTEADTYGKFLMTFMLLFLPMSLVNTKKLEKQSLIVRHVLLFELLAFITLFVLNITRSAISGFIFGFLAYLILNEFKNLKINGKLKINLKPILLVLSAFIMVFIISSSTGRISYVWERITTLFKIQAVIYQDVSGAYRYETIYSGMKLFGNQNLLTKMLGNGWAGITISIGTQDVPGTSNLFVNLLLYSGIIGSAIFTLMLIKMLYTLLRAYIDNDDLISLGVCLAIIGNLVASIFAPSILASEFWFLLGIAIYMEYKYKHLQAT